MSTVKWSAWAVGLTCVLTSSACLEQSPFSHTHSSPALQPTALGADPAIAEPAQPPLLSASPLMLERAAPRQETPIGTNLRLAKSIILPKTNDNHLDEELVNLTPVEPSHDPVGIAPLADSDRATAFDLSPYATRPGPVRLETPAASDQPSRFQNEIRWTLGVGLAATMVSGLVMGGTGAAEGTPDDGVIAFSGVTLGVGVVGMATAGILTLLDDGPAQPLTIGAGLGYAHVRVPF